MANILRSVVGDRTTTLTHVSLSWHGEFWQFRHPLDYIGSDGGGGVGGGPGISVGAALALKGTGRMPIAVCGDGDFMMGCTAVWTAVHYRIPILFLVANNRSFYNDEVHQERVAVARNRPVDNKWIGQRISDPDIDIGHRGARSGREGLRTLPECRRAGKGAQGGRRRGRERRRRGGRCAHPWRLQPGDRRRHGARQGRSRQLSSRHRRARSASLMPAAQPIAHSGRRGHRQAFRDAGRCPHGRRWRVVHGCSGRIPGGDRPVRLRQIHAVQRDRRAARRLRRPRQRGRRDGARAASIGRHDLPGGVDLPLAHRRSTTWRFRSKLPAWPRPSGWRRPATSSIWSDSTASSGAIRRSSRAACASACRWRARSPPSRRSC